MHGKATLAAVALLAGCAGPRPAVPPDAQVVPLPSWRTAVSPSGFDVSLTWWESFRDPGLTRIITVALASNDDVKIAATRVAEVIAQAELARAQRLPNVNGAVGIERDRNINPASGNPQVATTTEPVVTFSFDADLFGRLRSASEAARANVLASKAAQADVQLLVAASAARQWFTLRSLDARLAILKQTYEARQRSLQLVRRRVNAGYAATLDLAQAESDLRATEEQIPAAKLAIRRVEDALNTLLGRNPGDIERGDPALAPTLPAIPAALPSALLRRRPDIVEAEETIVAADHVLDASRAAFMPDLQLSGSLGRVTSTLLKNGPIDLFTFGASILAPIFEGGRLKAQEDASAARRDEAAFEYRKTVLRAFSEVEDSLAATQLLREQYDALLAQETALLKTFQIASERYRAGYSPFLDQLDAQRNLLSVQLSVEQARADELNAYVTLFQAMGGGWDRAVIEDSQLSAKDPSDASR